ncbi:MAG: ATP-binding cassette domain-containing protein [Bacillales bacterium]|jgi:putative ABC transport system permease protein|nr:ATP-binding cassette domain-containing protein [Bacillales bacterium]
MYYSLLNIKNILKKPVEKLSGGQKSRVALLRSFIKPSIILLADEPTGSLDSKNSQIVMEALKEISLTKLVILVSHNKELVYKYSDSIIHLKDGSITNIEEIEKPIPLLKEKEYQKTPLKKTLFKYALKYMTFYKTRTILSVLFSCIGLIGIILAHVLSNGFTNYFANSLEQFNNLDGIFMYENYIEDVKMVSSNIIKEIALENNLEYGTTVIFPNSETSINNTLIAGLNVNIPVELLGQTSFAKIDLEYDEIGMEVKGDWLEYIASLLRISSNDIEQINDKLLTYNMKISFQFKSKEGSFNKTLKIKHITKSNNISYYHGKKDFLNKIFPKVELPNEFENNGFYYISYLFKTDINSLIRNDKYEFVLDKINNTEIILVYYALAKKYFFDEIDNYLNNKISGFIYPIMNVMNPLGTLENGYISYPKIIDNISIIYRPLLEINEGRIPNENEIVISTALYSLINNNTFKYLFKESNKEVEFTITGLIPSDQFYIYANSFDFFTSLLNQLDIDINFSYSNALTFFCYNSQDITTVSQKLQKIEPQAVIFSPFFEIQKSIDDIIQKICFGINALSLVCILNSLLLLGVISYRGILSQNKYIAILKTLGYSKKHILFLFIIISLLTSSLAYLVSISLFILMNSEVELIFQNLLNHEGDLMSIDYLFLIKIGIYLIIFSTLASLLPSLNLANKDLLETIRE